MPRYNDYKYNLFISLLIKSSADGIVSELVKRGYEVSAASESGNNLVLSNNQCIGHLLAIHLSCNVSMSGTFKEIKEVLEDLSVLYFGIILCAHNDGFTWSGSNVKESKKTKLGPGPYRKNHLKLVEDSENSNEPS